jgi:putative transcriptional regulator
MKLPKPGILLIAEPFLKDPSFTRSVVLLCDHQEEGSIGFLLNKNIEMEIGDLISDLAGYTFPVYFGGPVQIDTIHFLHNVPGLIKGSFEVGDGIFWGGDFDEVKKLIKADKLSKEDIKFFLGYSGWTVGQLEGELNDKSWLTTDATRKIVFFKNIKETWKESILHLGGAYTEMANYPLDPLLN